MDKGVKNMTYEEKRELRLQISQLLTDAGLNQETLKEMAREELEKKSERAIKQVVEKSVREIMPNMLRREIQQNLSLAVKSEIHNRIIQVVLKDVENQC
jgi:gamma-glutamylcysteine synthetase